MVWSPGAAASTFGMEFTTMDAVAMPPWTPAAIFRLDDTPRATG